jgi:hypothetical protein
MSVAENMLLDDSIPEGGNAEAAKRLRHIARKAIKATLCWLSVNRRSDVLR